MVAKALLYRKLNCCTTVYTELLHCFSELNPHFNNKHSNNQGALYSYASKRCRLHDLSKQLQDWTDAASMISYRMQHAPPYCTISAKHGGIPMVAKTNEREISIIQGLL